MAYYGDYTQTAQKRFFSDLDIKEQEAFVKQYKKNLAKEFDKKDLVFHSFFYYVRKVLLDSWNSVLIITITVSLYILAIGKPLSVMYRNDRGFFLSLLAFAFLWIVFRSWELFSFDKVDEREKQYEVTRREGFDFDITPFLEKPGSPDIEHNEPTN